MSDNSLIRCYELVPGLGIRAVDVTKAEYLVNTHVLKFLEIARAMSNPQKPRVAPRRADWQVVG